MDVFYYDSLKVKLLFTYKHKIPIKESHTTFGAVTIKDIFFDPSEIESKLPEIVLSDENIKYMFSAEYLSKDKRREIYNCFIPKDKVSNCKLHSYISEQLQKNVNFYSFLAEGILSLVFRDVEGYLLTKGVIDVFQTLSDSHSGVDACMYNLERQIIVLGEAKFYEKVEPAINNIINDFTKKNIRNKLESLQRISENSEETRKIIINNISNNNYDELTIKEFINQKIIFAGFVLHSESNVKKFEMPNYYYKFDISQKLIEENVNSCVNGKVKECYEIVLTHLPIESKKKLIEKMIENSRLKLQELKK